MGQAWGTVNLARGAQDVASAPAHVARLDPHRAGREPQVRDLDEHQAIALRQAAVGILGDGAVRVTVMEEDGTTFVVYSTSQVPGALPMGECVEY